MALFKRGKTWWVRFTAPSGKQIRCSARTTDRKAAQKYHDSLKLEYWRVEQLGGKPRFTWQEAVERWLDETEHKASRRDDLNHLRQLHPLVGHLHLDEISRDIVDQFIRKRKDSGVSNATINRGLALIRAILRRAHREWEWLESVPTIKLLPEPKRRVRWLSRDQVDQLMIVLPSHLKALVRFTLATGLRLSNVTGLEWEQVDLERHCLWIHADQAKGKKAIPVPLNEDALSVLHEQRGKHSQFVFTYRNQAIKNANTKAWRKALKKVGIEDFRWHDLRHTWATWHVQCGTPLNVLQELGGWSNQEMVQRYAHLSAEHLAHYANVLTKKEIFSTNLAQSRF